MLDVMSHMLQLRHTTRKARARPRDGSFAPLSLTIACLLQKLHDGLATPSSLSLYQIDHLSISDLDDQLNQLLQEEGLDEAFAVMRSLVLYVKSTRALLAMCYEHVSGRIDAEDAMDAVVDYITNIVTPSTELEEDNVEEEVEVEDDDNDNEDDVVSEEEQVIAKPTQKAAPRFTRSALREQSPPRTSAIHAVDPSGIMKRAVGRDIGDGSAILEIMSKYRKDTKIQLLGVRALKSVIRKRPQSTSHSRNDESEMDEKVVHNQVEIDPVIQTVLSAMEEFPSKLDLQREALFCLSHYANQHDFHVANISAMGGLHFILHALAQLPDDPDAQISGLSILGHPSIARPTLVIDVAAVESRRLVLSTMHRFPLNEQLQGLACLALTTLSLRDEESMQEIVSKRGIEHVVAAMKRFNTTNLVQAAGCWFLATISAKDEALLTACLDAGGLPVCERARVRFEDDQKVQQHALVAIQNMTGEHVASGSECGIQ